MVFYFMDFNDYLCDNILCSENALNNKKFIGLLEKHAKKGK